MREIRYELCDVFTDRPLTGNALAVFTDADGVDGATMQALARETNLSESSFVLSPSTADGNAAIRIFTPTMELPFAGHPTLGTAFVLASPRQQTLFRLETGRGVVTVRLSYQSARPPFGWMTQPLPQIEPYGAASTLLTALGVKASTLPVDLYDNGPHYVYVGLDTLDEVAALRPDMSRLAALGTTAFCVFAGQDRAWKCRVFAPGEGIAEDPATGAAAGPLAVHLARHGRIAFGDESSSSKASRSDDHRPCMRARAEVAIGSRVSRSAGTPSSWDRERSGCPDDQEGDVLASGGGRQPTDVVPQSLRNASRSLLI